MPRISIIIATYNRSNVLRYTIRSVLRSTFSDWELIVVGDECTDDTEEVVASFRDPRIRFFNLTRNFGDQGGPNNEGLRHARGEFVAYLSHDDLWRETHLETLLQGMSDIRADLLFTLGVAVLPHEKYRLVGAVPGLQYSPSVAVPASLWFARRDFLESVGPWKHPLECRIVPSQDLLLRAWRMGKKMQLVPKVSVVMMFAGSRPDAYKNRDFIENQWYFEAMCNRSDFWENLLSKALLSIERNERGSRLWPPLRRVMINMAKAIGKLMDITPIEMMAILRGFGRKGARINAWRKKIGLSPIR